MLAARRRLTLLAISALAASLAMAPAATAQSPSPEPGKCALLTVEEVASAFAVTDVELQGWSSEFDCGFREWDEESGIGGHDFDLSVTIEIISDLESKMTEYPEGAALTVAGRPAWSSKASLFDRKQLWVDAGEQLLWFTLDGFADMTEEARQAALATLAELALPRIPAGPNQDDRARLEALIPDTIGDEVVTVQFLSGAQLLTAREAEDPTMKPLMDALAAQGKTAADVLLASAGTGTGTGIIVMQVKGADASSLLLPLLNVVASEAMTSETTTADIGGKQVTVVATDPVFHVYSTGDLAVLATGPEEFLADFFASLP